MEQEIVLLYQWIGSKIAYYRQQKGISQIELAEQASLSRSSISNIEKGRQQAPLHLLWRLGTVLQISISDLLPLDNEHIPMVQGIPEMIESNTELPNTTQKKVISFFNEEFDQ